MSTSSAVLVRPSSCASNFHEVVPSSCTTRQTHTTSKPFNPIRSGSGGREGWRCADPSKRLKVWSPAMGMAVLLSTILDTVPPADASDASGASHQPALPAEVSAGKATESPATPGAEPAPNLTKVPQGAQIEVGQPPSQRNLTKHLQGYASQLS